MLDCRMLLIDGDIQSVMLDHWSRMVGGLAMPIALKIPLEPASPLSI
ncbi:hypothetical protein GCM10007934_21850 [Mycoavidus cysteinexigens]|nr:hypothetical protein [Mycoavidus cysteinexigens]GAM51912.1 hypothetical protein EBME_0375 [bacterium endosymbiont of Mortierella elongata FMR23-6]GLR02368.1 hypothetical protein GCM10007934_21850 [Mycoavidus cysteinexigens]